MNLFSLTRQLLIQFCVGSERHMGSKSSCRVGSVNEQGWTCYGASEETKFSLESQAMVWLRSQSQSKSGTPPPLFFCTQLPAFPSREAGEPEDKWPPSVSINSLPVKCASPHVNFCRFKVVTEKELGWEPASDCWVGGVWTSDLQKPVGLSLHIGAERALFVDWIYL